MNEEPHGWPADDDLWAGATEDDGRTPRDEVYGAGLDPHVTVDTPKEMTAGEAIAARYRLPEEFWGAREMFKRIRQAAWASGNHPDAVLACVLARAAGAIGHEIAFDSARGPHGTLSLYVCLLAKSGIGKSEAYKAAVSLVQLPRHLTGGHGAADPDVFRDGMGIGTGEGVAEAFMGSAEIETGKMVMKGRGRNAQPEPEVKTVRQAVRHRAFFFVDEGETLTRLMKERQGATLGPTLRTAWSGGTLGQANATDDRFRYVPQGSYTVGIAIGYQPDTAVAMLSDVGPGTPQRFLWFGAQDTEMPAEFHEWPESLCLPPEGAATSGVIHFPQEIKTWLRAQHRAKHRGEIEIDPMDSHEPLMRCKLAALLCYLDGRMLVDRSDWVLGGMIWSVSCAIRNRLIRERDSAEAQRRDRERTERVELATEIEVMKVRVSADVERVARRLVKRIAALDEEFQSEKTWKMKKNFGRDKAFFDAALAHAKREGWVAGDEVDGCLALGSERPS